MKYLRSKLRQLNFTCRRCVWVIVSLWFLSGPSPALAAAKSTIVPHLISADVKVEQLTSNREVWRSQFGTISEREALNIRVGVLTTRYSGRESHTLKVKFFFIAQSRDRDGRLALYHYHEVDHKLSPNQTTRSVSLSPVISLRRTSVRGSPIEAEGIVPFGWVVRIGDGARTLKTFSSTPEMPQNLEKVLARTPADVLTRLNADAEKRMTRN
jgi:hypothetical protein